MENPDNIAVCLACGNEWEVRDPGAKKKRKCPICGKYRVKMKSEVNDAVRSNDSPPDPGLAAPDPGGEVENSPAISPELEENTPAGEENSPGEKEKSRRKQENSPRKKRGEKENSPPEKTGEKGEENSTGGSGWLLVAALIVLGVLACSFLTHAPSHQSHQKQAAQHNGIRKASIYG